MGSPLAAKFAEDALNLPNMRQSVWSSMRWYQLEQLRADAQEIPNLTGEKFLEIYKNTVVNVKDLSKENIEFYLTTPYYTLRMLKTPGFKGRIIDFCCEGWRLVESTPQTYHA